MRNLHVIITAFLPEYFGQTPERFQAPEIFFAYFCNYGFRGMDLSDARAAKLSPQKELPHERLSTEISDSLAGRTQKNKLPRCSLPDNERDDQSSKEQERGLKQPMLHRKYREIAYALLRATLGVMFFFYGLDKFIRGLDQVAADLSERFIESTLPEVLAEAFA